MPTADIPRPDFTRSLESGEPFTVDPIDAAQCADQLAAYGTLRPVASLVDGPLSGSFVVAGADGELPPFWTVHDGDGAGGVTSTRYRLSRPTPMSTGAYYVDGVTTQEGSPELSTAVDPTLGARFLEAGNDAVARVHAADHAAANTDNPDLSPQHGAPGEWYEEHTREWHAAEPEPEPVNRRQFVPCRSCHGLGSVVLRDMTAELRRQGYPYTVTGPCAGCLGAGGLTVDAAASD